MSFITSCGFPNTSFQIKCFPCDVGPSDWPYNPDFWTCPKCDSTYIKKYLFEKVKRIENSCPDYDLMMNVLQGSGNFGYIQISEKGG